MKKKIILARLFLHVVWHIFSKKSNAKNIINKIHSQFFKCRKNRDFLENASSNFVEIFAKSYHKIFEIKFNHCFLNIFIVLCAQRSDWRTFRRSQQRLRHHYRNKSFSIFLSEVRERRRTYELNANVHILLDAQKQSRQQN